MMRFYFYFPGFSLQDGTFFNVLAGYINSKVLQVKRLSSVFSFLFYFSLHYVLLIIARSGFQNTRSTVQNVNK